MTESIPVYTKGTDKVLQAEPAPANQVVQINMPDIVPPKALLKGDAKASAKSAKVMNKNEIDDAEIALRKEKERARQAAYREANPEKVKAAVAKYQVANREKLKAYQAAYRAAKKAEAAAAITTTGDNHG